MKYDWSAMIFLKLKIKLREKMMKKSKYDKITIWRIVLETETGEKIEFDTDIPLSISDRIDDMVREFYETTF